MSRRLWRVVLRPGLLALANALVASWRRMLVWL
jgi:hypothetical protein